MKECERCFWFSVVKGIRRPNGVFPSLQSGIDVKLKRYFDNFRVHGELPPELKAAGIDAELFQDQKQLNVWRDYRKGAEFVDDKGNIFKAIVDDLLIKDGKLIIVDYKTRGFALQDNTAHYNKDQLDIYNWVFRELGLPTYDYAYLIYYIPKGIARNGAVNPHMIFNVDVVKMKVDVDNAKNLFKRALEILTLEEPPEGGCVYCQPKTLVVA